MEFFHNLVRGSFKWLIELGERGETKVDDPPVDKPTEEPEPDLPESSIDIHNILHPDKPIEEEKPPEEEPPAEEPPVDPPADEPQTEEVDGVTYTIDPKTGDYLIGSHVVLDKDKVPYFNRVRERDDDIRKRDAEIERLQRPAQPDKPVQSPQEMKKAYYDAIRQKHPQFDIQDEQLDVIVTVAKDMAQSMVDNIKPMLGKVTGDSALQRMQKDTETYPHYAKYKSEIDNYYEKAPADYKSTPDKAERALKLCYNHVISSHINDIIAEATKNGQVAATKDKKILDQFGKPKGTKTPSKRASTLTKAQEDEASDMGIDTIAYRKLLDKKIERAKENGKPTPKLVRT